MASPTEYFKYGFLLTKAGANKFNSSGAQGPSKNNLYHFTVYDYTDPGTQDNLAQLGDITSDHYSSTLSGGDRPASKGTAVYVGETQDGKSFVGRYKNGSYTLYSNSNNYPAGSTFTTSATPFNLVQTVCYVSGTLIRTAGGDVAVDHLTVGDVVVTSSGEHRPIRWLGHRLTDCRHHPRPSEVMPVRVAAHAFGADCPARDLLVSPAHALCVDLLGEVLIPAGSLVNGTTVRREDVDAVTYWHVELDCHDILLAENMGAESYLEVGNRGFFAESDVVDLAAGPDAAAGTVADFCRPFHSDGAIVEAVRERLAVRAATQGWTLQPAPAEEVHLLVDGVRVDGRCRDSALSFRVPAASREVWLVSDTSVPCEVDAASRDMRSLGVAVRHIVIEGGLAQPVTISADDPLLDEGFHEADCGTHRWTAGRARLPAALWDGRAEDFDLRVELACPPLPRWIAPPVAGEMQDLLAA